MRHTKKIILFSLVSIGIADYDAESTFSRGIESTLGRSFRNTEIAMPDNTSSDRTSEICLEFQEYHFTITPTAEFKTNK